MVVLFEETLSASCSILHMELIICEKVTDFLYVNWSWIICKDNLRFLTVE